MTDRADALSRTIDLLAELLGPERRNDIDRALGTARVTISVEPGLAADASTQTAVYTAAMLLVRSGMAVAIDMSSAPRRVDLPGLDGTEFAEAMGDVLPRMMPPGPSAPMSEHAIAIGGVASAVDGRTYRLGATEEATWFARSTVAPAWRPGGPIIAMAAGALAAGEIHKDVLRELDDGRAATYLAPSDLRFRAPTRIDRPVDLSSTVAISGGAIVQNAIFALAAEERIRGAIRALDVDRIEPSNLNRGPFVLMGRPWGAKVDAIATLSPARLRIEPLDRNLTSGNLGLIGRDDYVLVGADAIEARHLAQRARPRWLGVGATSHFLAMISEHRPGEPCAGCAHPLVETARGTVPTISLVSFWAGYLLALRLVAAAQGRSRTADRRITNFWPLRPGAMREHALAFNPRCPIGHTAAR